MLHSGSLGLDSRGGASFVFISGIAFFSSSLSLSFSFLVSMFLQYSSLLPHSTFKNIFATSCLVHSSISFFFFFSFSFDEKRPLKKTNKKEVLLSAKSHYFFNIYLELNLKKKLITKKKGCEKFPQTKLKKVLQIPEMKLLCELIIVLIFLISLSQAINLDIGGSSFNVTTSPFKYSPISPPFNLTGQVIPLGNSSSSLSNCSDVDPNLKSLVIPFFFF